MSDPRDLGVAEGVEGEDGECEGEVECEDEPVESDVGRVHRVQTHQPAAHIRRQHQQQTLLIGTGRGGGDPKGRRRDWRKKSTAVNRG